MTKIAGWTELDDRAVAYARALAMDAVQKVGNGHPGTSNGAGACCVQLIPAPSCSRSLRLTNG
jgi:transketolase